MDVIIQFQRYLTKPHVRPLALSAPILVLLVCLPMLRPLRHPAHTQISDDELARLATIQSLADHQTLAIDRSTFLPASGTVKVHGRTYSTQPPMMALLLAGPYWLMQRGGFSFSGSSSLVCYLLTLVGVTLPVAGAAGLIYRMGRLFELVRWKRACLAAVVVFASGLISYGVVLNSHAPAAALVLAAAGCLVHVAISKRPTVAWGWLLTSGFCAALAATIEPSAVLFLVLLIAVIPAMRWSFPMRLGGAALYLLGAAPVLLLHVILTVPLTGDLRPAMWHSELSNTVAAPVDPADEDAPGAWGAAGRLCDAVLGDHGLLSHFPVLALGIAGIAAVMHRHWPMTTKVLAACTGTAAGVILVVSCFTGAGSGDMFGARWFIVFLPFLVFWSGAWLRRRHHPVTWSLAAGLACFSILVSLVGLTDPFPRQGYGQYSAGEALEHWLGPPVVPPRTVLAGG